MSHTFVSRAEFRDWLDVNGQTSQGIWINLSKTKDRVSLSATEALEEALCFGWIDGQMKPVDDLCYLKYFAPRTQGSRWSEKNKKLVEELRNQGKLTPQGEAVISAAQGNGQWNAPPKETDFELLQVEFEPVIACHPLAQEKFRALSPSRKKQVLGFFFEAKQEETKKKRLAKIVDSLENDKKGMLF